MGIPQGGVVSPVLSNLFLHYTFDAWMTREFPEVRWCRYADALEEAIAQGGDAGEIDEAELALDDGDALRDSGTFKDAVNKYKDALAKAESALP